ncbi:glycosyl hydrolase [Talaromyces proteolyticus]|uniref:Glycosyl hydrolase n=1 Tax=Talaromyces proteolyticus TaxID=1131652 RepID=A0AAD4KNC6_9EURO|nr:glycosyl hydrolase [Talaromyces proteolyticus]KAH8693070.1 glycosyl hydrolase [Talaromyces proteolyticus]
MMIDRGSCTTVRPTIHITAPCWINDPCAPGYDPKSKRYHLFYQCNPRGTEWGNMSWGHVTSPDLLTWNQSTYQPALEPDQDYDKEGVFTGCFLQPEGTTETRLTVFYSSVCCLPFHWSTPPYPRGAAGLAMAISSDGGRTWSKPSENPILGGEPDGVQVTGFRDPYIANWPAMDELQCQHSLYAIISGGIQGAGPTVFLYAVSPDNLTHWEYLGPLINLPEKFQQSKKWSGNYGINWECTNFMTLETESTARQCLILGAEGDVERDHIKHHRQPLDGPVRTVRSLLWMFGDLTTQHTNGGVKFQYKRGGYLDHGSLYAANSFLDPASGRRIMHGWIPEEDITCDYARRKGWNGALCIPRELFLLCLPNVTAALRTELSEIASVEVMTCPDGSTSLYTLGIRPISEFTRLREYCIQTSQRRSFHLPRLTLREAEICTIQTPCWELEAIISVRSDCDEVGFCIQSTSNSLVRLRITFSVVEETITVDRAASTVTPEISTFPEKGPITLFFTQPDGMADKPKLENLHLRAIFDADIVEIFANDRFALATTVYSGSYTSGRIVSAFAAGCEHSASFEEVRVWDGLYGCKDLLTVD